MVPWKKTPALALQQSYMLQGYKLLVQYIYLPTSQGNQYLDILPPNSISHGWTKIAQPNSSAAYM